MPFDPNMFANRATGQKYDLTALVRRQKNPRRKEIVIRPVIPTQALAADLYASSYKPLITAMTASMPAIVAAYEAGLPVRDSLIRDSTDQAQQQTSSLGEQLQRLVLTLAPALHGWATRVEKWQRGQWRGSVLSATGVDIDTVLMMQPQPVSVGEYIGWNTALMKDVGAQAQQKMTSTIFAAFQARQPAADLARDLRDIVSLSRRRSLGIAADQLSKLSSALDTERMADAGITEFKYRHSGKVHYRPWHRARDGNIYDLDSGKQVGGADVIAGDDMPGIPPWCGCRKQAVIRFD